MSKIIILRYSPNSWTSIKFQYLIIKGKFLLYLNRNTIMFVYINIRYYYKEIIDDERAHLTEYINSKENFYKRIRSNRKTE